MEDIVYHGSPIQNLSIVNPQISSHNKSYVYGTKHANLAALFIANVFGDLAYSLSYHYSKSYSLPVIQEKFKGAFELAHGSETKPRTGSIYTLPSKTFKENMTGWPEDLVSIEPVKTLDEFKIEDVYQYLLELESQRKIFIGSAKRSLKDSELYHNITKSKMHSSEKEKYLADIKRYNPSILGLFY